MDRIKLQLETKNLECKPTSPTPAVAPQRSHNVYNFQPSRTQRASIAPNFIPQTTPKGDKGEKLLNSASTMASEGSPSVSTITDESPLVSIVMGEAPSILDSFIRPRSPLVFGNLRKINDK